MNKCIRPFELVHHLKTSKAKVVISAPELLKNLLIAAEEVGIPKENVLLFDNHGEPPFEGLKSWRTLFEHGEADWPRFNDLETASNTTAARLYSSGTTGMGLCFLRRCSSSEIVLQACPRLVCFHTITLSHSRLWLMSGSQHRGRYVEIQSLSRVAKDIRNDAW